jgi:ABC-type Fe3+/spermidine/putrescine transport system ATPase subunit
VGTTTIYVTHDQEEAMSLSDRVAVMNEGRVVEVAPPRALYLRPRTRFAAQFVGQADLLEGTVVGADDDARVVDTPLGRLRAITSAPAWAGAEVEGESHNAATTGGVSVLIRPEHIELHARPQGVLNEVPGVIERLMFSGRIVEYVVMAGDQRVRVQGTSREMFEAGQSVVMVLPPEHCVVVTA